MKKYESKAYIYIILELWDGENLNNLINSEKRLNEKDSKLFSIK